MNDFLAGMIEGAKETPRAYFAPIVALWRLLDIDDAITAWLVPARGLARKFARPKPALSPRLA